MPKQELYEYTIHNAHGTNPYTAKAQSLTQALELFKMDTTFDVVYEVYHMAILRRHHGNDILGVTWKSV